MIFLDTSAVVALLDRRDSEHERAKKAWKKANREALVTTDLVLAEIVTLLRRRVGFEAACAAGERFLSGSVAEIRYADSPLMGQAWTFFERYDDQELSLTDCVSFALMKERRIRQAFAFDQDFRTAGFELIRG